jgi:hypothetical protein
MINWQIFNLIFNQREQSTFEELSYLLFCAEFDKRLGVFRYKNQTGIETEPIIKDDVVYGFQAKYYTTPISQNKADIIDSIQKAKTKNSNLNKILLYTNQELSESSKKTKKKPDYQIDIENEAQKIGIKIEWRVSSNFEAQLALPENKYIYDLFFNLDPNSGDLIDEIKKHNDNILQTIQTEIIHNDKQIKVDRTNFISQIKQAIDTSQNIIISGEGGCGKTAIFKEFYTESNKQYPICIFKANELNVNNINDIFRFDHNFSFAKFLETYQPETKKIFVIDSAERLLELNNTEILNDLIQRLKEEKWIIVFTTRYSYLDVLNFTIKDIYHLPCEIIDIPILDNNELLYLSEIYSFYLPENQKFTERLRNPFYLNEYIQELTNIDKKGNFRGFVNLIWRKRIQNFSYQKDNIHLEREKYFIYIAKERCNTGLFYINADKLSGKALSKLEQDEIIKYDENQDGYFITHDIYEEWALEKIIVRCFAYYTDSKQFFSELGDSLPIRRAFRLWLSEQLSENIDAVKEFINDTFTNDEVLQHWKDELVVSILLSDYADVFFTQFEKEIMANDFTILNRILFLIQIACKEEDTVLQKLLQNNNSDYLPTKPKGKGWEVVIAFIYKHRENYFDNHLKLILPILTDWVNSDKEGEATRFAGLLALGLIKKRANTERFYFERDTKEIILKIIYNSAKELKPELQEIFDKVIANKWVNHDAPYEELCSMILEKPVYAIEVIKILPLSVIQLCNLFWQKRKKDNYRYERDEMEDKYGLVNEYRFNYFPASALQTPIYWLLQYAFKETLDFIIDFTNRSVEYYRKSDYGKEDVEEITLHIEDKEIKQYLCWAFWGMYRGIGNPVVPDLLQSIHMALEKILLQYAQIDASAIELILLLILTKSKSTSLTAVVCSSVLANPDKFYNIALILFRTIELFHIDSQRQMQESQSKSLYGIGYGMNGNTKAYQDERLKTCEDKHRSLNLETLFRNYEFFGIKGATEDENTKFIQKLYEIIDQHKITISTKTNANAEQKIFGILLARMDRRIMHPTVQKIDDLNYIIDLNPELSSELREHSEQATQEASAFFRYSPLKMWGILKNEGNEKAATYPQYESNPLSALKEVKEFIQGIENGTIQLFPTDEYIPPFICSALMRFYREQLDEDDFNFCKNIIVGTVSQIFSDAYCCQISDGVEVAIHAMPTLMSEYPEGKESFTIMMLLTLFDVTSIGAYKRVCDYVIETIHESKIWEHTLDTAQAILLGFIKLKPIYNQIFIEKRKTWGAWGRTSKRDVINDFESKVTERFGEFSLSNLSFDIQDIVSLDIYDLEIIYQLIPSNTRDKIHLDIYKNTLSIIISQLLVDRRNNKEYSNIYSLRRNIFKRFAFFILERNINEIDDYLQSIIASFNATEEMSLLLDEIISAEDYINKYEAFWYIWNKFYPKFVETCKNSYGFHLGIVINSYLLAWQWWREGVTEWHSLKEENLSFYANIAKDLGNNSNVLYSISKVLNSIGSNFLDDGVNWIYTIISENKLLELKDLETNTLYYLEKLMRRFILINKERVKQELKLKNKIVFILEFMIERGSVRGYLLRDSLL